MHRVTALTAAGVVLFYWLLNKIIFQLHVFVCKKSTFPLSLADFMVIGSRYCWLTISGLTKNTSVGIHLCVWKSSRSEKLTEEKFVFVFLIVLFLTLLPLLSPSWRLVLHDFQISGSRVWRSCGSLFLFGHNLRWLHVHPGYYRDSTGEWALCVDCFYRVAILCCLLHVTVGAPPVNGTQMVDETLSV